MTTSRVALLIVLASALAGAPAVAACRWYGTQLHCDARDGRVVIGTQAADEPSYARAVRPQAFACSRSLLDCDPPPRRLELQLQDVGADPSLCRRIGNETYCY